MHSPYSDSMPFCEEYFTFIGGEETVKQLNHYNNNLFVVPTKTKKILFKLKVPLSEFLNLWMKLLNFKDLNKAKDCIEFIKRISMPMPRHIFEKICDKSRNNIKIFDNKTMKLISKKYGPEDDTFFVSDGFRFQLIDLEGCNRELLHYLKLA